MNGGMGVVVAFFAGLLSFLSPCVLPLIPIYLSFISGESAADLKAGTARKGAIIVRALLFSAGFTAIFVLLAILSKGGMSFVGSGAKETVVKIAAGIIIILAFNTLFDFLPFLRVELRAGNAGKRTPMRGGLGAILYGMAFAAGWTPCIGPILSSLLLFAGSGDGVSRAAILLTVYSAGFAVPFILAAAFLDRALPVMGWFKRHTGAIRVATAAILLLFAVLLLTGGLSSLSSLTFRAAYEIETAMETLPPWIKPMAKILARWLSFQGI